MPEVCGIGLKLFGNSLYGKPCLLYTSGVRCHVAAETPLFHDGFIGTVLVHDLESFKHHRRQSGIFREHRALIEIVEAILFPDRGELEVSLVLAHKIRKRSLGGEESIRASRAHSERGSRLTVIGAVSYTHLSPSMRPEAAAAPKTPAVEVVCQIA